MFNNFKILKIVQISSRDSDERSKVIKNEINNYWKMMTEKGEAKQFAEAFYLLENENIGRLIINLNQVFHNPSLIRICTLLLEAEATELHYYFHK
jgi:hypothetical protein